MPNWRKLLVSGSDANLNRLTVTQTISASFYDGDGSRLSNIFYDGVAADTLVSASFSNVSSTVINHNFGTKEVLVQVYNNLDQQIIPETITTTDVNTVTLDFGHNISGRAVVGKAGHVVSAYQGTTNSASLAQTAKVSVSASYAHTSSVSVNSQTSISASHAIVANSSLTADLATSASHAVIANTSLISNFSNTSTSASYALTASYALNGGGGGASVTVDTEPPTDVDQGSLWWNEEDGNMYIQVQSPQGSLWVPSTSTLSAATPSTYRSSHTGSSWTVNHNLDEQHPIVQIYSGSKMIIPAEVTITNSNTVEIEFAYTTVGTVVVKK